MDIYAKKGDKVKVTQETASNGFDFDRSLVSKYLEVGKVYTVEFVDIQQYSANIKLQEFPNNLFNTTNFVDA